MDQPQLVIFDCDGVLVDSEVISNEVLAHMLTAQGLPTTLSESRLEYQGLLLSDVASRAEAKLHRALPADWLERYQQRRNDAFRDRLEPVTGAAEAVRHVSAAAIKVCVASQGRLEKTRLTLGLTGLASLFAQDALFSAASVARGKPHPDLFLHAAATMGAPPERCTVIEDTASGVTAAVTAGMRALGYAADSDEQALREAGAEILGSLAELPAMLGIEAERRALQP
jgi:HAD superfamily hydrolase (TIGR01509 family)